MKFETLYPVHDGFQYKATTYILGKPFHVELIRLVNENGLIEPPEDAPEETWQLFEDMQVFSEGAYRTVEVPRLEGEWALFITPFCR